jgi:hypothetical protein
MKTAIKVQNFSIKTHILKIFSAKIYFFVIFFRRCKKEEANVTYPVIFSASEKEKANAVKQSSRFQVKNRI